MSNPPRKNAAVSAIEEQNARIRAELAETLDAIESKMNPVLQAKRLGSAVKRRLDGDSGSDAGTDASGSVSSRAAAAKSAVGFIAGIAKASRKKD